MKANKPVKIKCNFCKKKCNLINFLCKCEKIYCTTCRYPHIHKCTYDYVKEEKLRIKTNNPVIINSKIIPI